MVWYNPMAFLRIDEPFLYPVKYGLEHLEKRALLLNGQQGGIRKRGHKFLDKGFFSAIEFLLEESQSQRIEADPLQFHPDIS